MDKSTNVFSTAFSHDETPALMQVFDSNAGELSPHLYAEFCVDDLKWIAKEIKRRRPSPSPFLLTERRKACKDTSPVIPTDECVNVFVSLNIDSPLDEVFLRRASMFDLDPMVG